ncbi:hypothetical protein G7046_g414 [Stylonectria norvegica]|nr:hypothetical protein G7046_g414 [Stylonectria norvegica]
MSFQATLTATLFAAALNGVLADPFGFCKDNTCSDCPVSVATAGTGYPNCVVYNTDDVFANQGFGGSAGGGFQAYLDVQQPDPGCKVIVKSPADTTVAGCGFEIASFSHGVCAELSLEKSFMVQFCCGIGDCDAAGAKRSVKFGRDGIAQGGASGVYLRDVNGNVIAPAQEGPPPGVTAVKTKRVADAPLDQVVKRSRCKSNSWIPNPGQEEYTRPADDTQIVMTGVSGPGSVTITKSRSQGWSSTVGVDIGFADILSLGLSTTTTQSKELTDTSSRLFTIGEGQTGDVGFTAYLQCTTGHGNCDGGDVSGEVCFPYNEGGGLAGQYAVVIHS